MTGDLIPTVILALRHEDRSMKIGSVADVEPLASISSNELDGTRRVYLFGWRDGQHGVWESTSGLDQATPAVRRIISIREDLQQLSALDEPYDLIIYRNEQPVRIRLAATFESPTATPKTRPGGASAPG